LPDASRREVANLHRGQARGRFWVASSPMAPLPGDDGYKSGLARTNH
jgi:hypothetical protein